MTFVSFNGVDNHKRSVTLVAALISDESLDSYMDLRVFKNYCVGNQLF